MVLLLILATIFSLIGLATVLIALVNLIIECIETWKYNIKKEAIESYKKQQELGKIEENCNISQDC